MSLRRFVSSGACFAWPLDNQPLQEARDRHVVTGNPTAGVGLWGPYLTFDGTTDYITLGAAWEDQLRFDAGTIDFSIVAWVRRVAAGAFGTIIDKEDADTDGWRFLLRDSDRAEFRINAVGATSPVTADTNWHCYIAVVDRSASITVYADGIAGTPQAIAGPAMATTANVLVGTRVGLSLKLAGDIAGIVVINRVLSPAECLGLSIAGGAF